MPILNQGLLCYKYKMTPHCIATSSPFCFYDSNLGILGAVLLHKRW